MPMEGISFQVKGFCRDRKYAGDNFNQQFLLPACRSPTSLSSSFQYTAVMDANPSGQLLGSMAPAASLRECANLNE